MLWSREATRHARRRTAVPIAAICICACACVVYRCDRDCDYDCDYDRAAAAPTGASRHIPGTGRRRFRGHTNQAGEAVPPRRGQGCGRRVPPQARRGWRGGSDDGVREAPAEVSRTAPQPIRAQAIRPQIMAGGHTNADGMGRDYEKQPRR